MALRFHVVAVLCVLLGAVGCNETSTMNLATYCPDNLDVVLVHDKEPWQPGYGDENDGEWTCMLPDEAARYHARQSEKDGWEDDLRDRLRTMEREDAIRSCILAGNQPDLCELDPGDPYGTGAQD
jgi:hypothetical protein